MARTITLKFNEDDFKQFYPDGEPLLKQYHLNDNFIGDDFLQEIKDALIFLESHNKNYTNRQYNRIADLDLIFKYMEVSK